MIHDQAEDFVGVIKIIEDGRMHAIACFAPDMGHPAAGRDRLGANDHPRQEAIQLLDKQGFFMLVRQIEQKVAQLIELALLVWHHGSSSTAAAP